MTRSSRLAQVALLLAFGLAACTPTRIHEDAGESVILGYPRQDPPSTRALSRHVGRAGAAVLSIGVNAITNPDRLGASILFSDAAPDDSLGPQGA